MNNLRTQPNNHNNCDQEECDRLSRYFSSIWSEKSRTSKSNIASNHAEPLQPTTADLADLAEISQHNILLEIKKLDI